MKQASVVADFCAISTRDKVVLQYPQWSTADAESKVPAAKNPELPTILSCKPGVGQNIDLHASPAASNSTSLISTGTFNFF